MSADNQVRVGVAILVCRSGYILLGKRKTAHAFGMYGLPGGHVEYGETLEECVARELKEETDLVGGPPVLVTATSDVFDSGKHYITLFYKVDVPADAQPVNVEPEKKESWEWMSPHEIPPGTTMPGLTKVLADWEKFKNLIA